MIDGRISLTTPEGVRLLLTPAGPVPRAWAWLFDIFIFFLGVLLLGFLLGDSKFSNGIKLLCVFILYWGYPVLCEVYCGGRTIGKLLMDIKVVRADGLPVGWRESILRNLLLVADFLPMMYFSGLICMLFDHKFRRIGDLVAGTQVVYRPKKFVRAAAIDATPIALPFPLTPTQQSTLISLFEREHDIPIERLHELGSMAEILTGETGEASLNRLRGFAAGMTQ